MKRILTLALVFGYAVATAQKTDNVGIGTTKPDPSAILDLNTTNKGFLMPRMTETERNAIKNPAMALKVYQIDGEKGEYTFDGTTWQSPARVGATNSVGAWDKQGNAIDGTDFLGTTNNEPLRFKVGGLNAGFISSNSTFLGNNAPSSTTVTGALNTGYGVNVMSSLISGANNTAIGANSQRSTTSSSNTSIGSASMVSNISGSENTSVGNASLYSNVVGESNTSIGFSSMFSNTSGGYNVAIGSQTLRSNQNGFFNMAIGMSALERNVSSSDNMAIGTEALRFSTGQRNTAIGTWAGRGPTTTTSGSSNIFIGYSAGANETASNKLYISNTDTSTPLIGGDFNNSFLKFHTGTSAPTSTAGFVAIGDFSGSGSISTPGSGAINSFPSFSTGSKYRLIVQDGILTEKLKVALRNGTEWADYVFEQDYKNKMMTLEEIENFTLKNKHLPNVLSANEMAIEGVDLLKTSSMLLGKIEELTLYLIEMNKEIKTLKKQIKKSKKI